jgi:hypothetical protein
MSAAICGSAVGIVAQDNNTSLECPHIIRYEFHVADNISKLHHVQCRLEGSPIILLLETAFAAAAKTRGLGTPDHDRQ